jgi:predicted transcriptional regulator
MWHAECLESEPANNDLHLADAGRSQRRIAHELGINREMVGRYLRLRKPAISISGSKDGSDRKPAISVTGVRAGRRSHLQQICHRRARSLSSATSGKEPQRSLWMDSVRSSRTRL